jgi:hypothetical protein
MSIEAALSNSTSLAKLVGVSGCEIAEAGLELSHGSDDGWRGQLLSQSAVKNTVFLTLNIRQRYVDNVVRIPKLTRPCAVWSFTSHVTNRTIGAYKDCDSLKPVLMIGIRA